MPTKGFTLVELMIVVAIIGILAVMAVPAYSAYITEASHSESNTILADISAKEEAYNQAWGTYRHVPTGTVFDFGQRQIHGDTTEGDFAQLGYEVTNSMGVFGMPVYFSYSVNAPHADNAGGGGAAPAAAGEVPDYTVTAQRKLVNGATETATITSINRRSILYSTNSTTD